MNKIADVPSIKIGMGDGVIASSPSIVSSIGLGSCVVVTLYDPGRKIGGVAHIMLPDFCGWGECDMPYKYADTAITKLLEGLSGKGAGRQDIVAKMVGGAKIFSSDDGYNEGIGERNIKSIREILKNEKIPLVGEDTGGNYGRSVDFFLDSGSVIVKTIGKGYKEI